MVSTTAGMHIGEFAYDPDPKTKWYSWGKFEVSLYGAYGVKLLRIDRGRFAYKSTAQVYMYRSVGNELRHELLGEIVHERLFLGEHYRLYSRGLVGNAYELIYFGKLRENYGDGLFLDFDKRIMGTQQELYRKYVCLDLTEPGGT